MDDIYSRSPLMGVSNPTNFVHQVHVGFDPVSGAFTGLPDQWTRLLTSSAITKEDYAKNPQAVLDVLEFYTDIQKREMDDYGLGGKEEVGESRNGGVGAPARFGAGTGFAGQRSDAASKTDAFSSARDGSAPSNAHSPTAQAGFRPIPGPPPRTDSPSNSSTSTPGGLRNVSTRPNLIPGRPAPGLPPSKPTNGAASGLKPLLTSSASRTNLKDQLPQANAYRTPPLPKHPPSSAVKPLQLASSSRSVESPSSIPVTDRLPTPSTVVPPSSVAKPLQTIKKSEKTERERRVSSMSEGQIMAKLRSVCSPQDPNTLYSKIKKVGQGASGSVYVAKVLASGAKVAIKQMDLSHQPRKELIVNEILVMKESQHPNIVNFLDSFLVKGAELWVVMEFMEGGALTDVIDSNSLEEEQISSISNEVSNIGIEGESLSDEFDRLARDCSIFTRRASSTGISRATTSSSIHKVMSKSVRRAFFRVAGRD